MVAVHRARTLLCAFLACAFLLTVLLSRSPFLQSDEGYTLNAAWQVWTGLKMYDDFRLFVGPGSGYAIYWAWRLAGSPSFLVARLVALALSFWSTTGLYLLLRRLGIRGVNLATAVIVWLSLSSLYVSLNHNSFSSFAAIWFLLALVRVVKLRSRPAGAAAGDRARDHALVGVAAGVVFLFLPMKASLLAASAAIFLFASGRPPRLRPVLALAAGFALVVAPLFAVWSPATLIRQWLIVPLTGNYLGHTSESGPYIAAAIVLVAAMGWTAFRLGDRVLQALAAVQAALFLGMSHNMESAHFAINAFPLVVFVAVVLQRRFPRSLADEGGRALLVMGGVTVALVAWGASPAGAEFFSGSTLHVDLLGHRPRGFSSPRIAAARAIYAGPFLPGLYYLLGKKNPFFVSETVVCDQACHRRLIAQLAGVKPELVFLDYPMVRHLSYDENAPVDAYLRDRYVPCAGHGEMTVRASEARFCP
jgi:hypothetical protein